MKFAAIAATTVAFTSTAFAGPVSDVRREIYDPKVLYPHTGTVWALGQTHNVTWNATDAPTNISNGSKIYLRKGNTTIMNHTLASGFDLRSGHHAVTVPTDIAPGKDYRIVLFGDSGNFGPQFQITATKPEFWGYPPVLYPRAGTVWKAGSSHNVTWDLSKAPHDIANRGAIFLNINGTNRIDLTGKSDFDLSTGRHEVTIPSNVSTGTYKLALFGYYDNYSPSFKIEH